MDYRWMVLSFVLAPNFIREPDSVLGLLPLTTVLRFCSQFWENVASDISESSLEPSHEKTNIVAPA